MKKKTSAPSAKSRIPAPLAQLAATDPAAVVAQFRAAIIQRNEVVASLERERALADQRHRPQIDAFQDHADLCFAALSAHFTANPTAIEATGKRSLDFPAGTIGFRTGNPELAPRCKFTIERVIELCRRYFPQWLRTKPELAKDAIHADLAAMPPEDRTQALAQVGLRLSQPVRFYIDPKLEDTPAKASTQIAPAAR